MDGGKYRDSIGRSYYAIFTAVRAVLANDKVDFSKHSGVKCTNGRNENVRLMLKNGRISEVETLSFFPKLTLKDAKELEAEIIQLI